MEKNKLPEPHFSVWHTLQSLGDGERIIGDQLMKRCGIKERRTLYSVVEDLRGWAFFVVGSKGGDRGYYEAREEIDVSRMLRDLRKPAYTQLKLADELEKAWLKRQYGHEIDPEGDDEDDETNDY